LFNFSKKGLKTPLRTPKISTGLPAVALFFSFLMYDTFLKILKKLQTEVKPSQHATTVRTRTMTHLLKKGWRLNHKEGKRVSTSEEKRRAVYLERERVVFEKRERTERVITNSRVKKEGSVFRKREGCV
jgi:hypothetical protein